MDKIQNLKEKARAFRALLASHDWKNTNAESLLRRLRGLRLLTTGQERRQPTGQDNLSLNAIRKSIY